MTSEEDVWCVPELLIAVEDEDNETNLELFAITIRQAALRALGTALSTMRDGQGPLALTIPSACGGSAAGSATACCG